jgi:hypothetical protein
MSDNTATNPRSRPFPWHCLECKEKSIYPLATDYTNSVKHDGRSYEIHIPGLVIPTCRKCGERMITSEVDDKIMAALRAHVGLLAPEEIRERRNELELSQQRFAEELGVAKESMIQSRAMDNLMRLYFESVECRDLLERRFKRIPVDRIIKCRRIRMEGYTQIQFALRN